jgi:glycosyltransferase involved in cell wall biosynthesis
MGTITYSIVIPLYNETASFPELVERLRDVMGRLDGATEIVMVDDGSSDGTYELIAQTAAQDERFRGMRLSRNFGHQVAITAGLDAACGEAVIVMDADLQDPPEVVVEMAARWREGYEVVYGVREQRDGETFFKKFTANAFYNLLHKFAEIEQPVQAGDFRLVDRKALDAFLQMRESHRYVRGMFSWVGFRQTGVPYIRDARNAGETKYTLRKMIKFAADGIIGFSTAPLRLALATGLFLAVAAMCYGVVAICLKLAGFQIVPGYTSLLVTITFLSGIQLTMIGMVGQYVARIYDEVRHRPLYFVRETHGFAPSWPVIEEQTRPRQR